MLPVKYSSLQFHLLPCILTLVVLVAFLEITLYNARTLNLRRSLLASKMLKNRAPVYTSEGPGNGVADNETISNWQENFFRKSKSARVAGKALEPNSKYLVIGIATVYRVENYLEKTLSSLIKESDEEERKDVVVVIYLADTLENNAKQLAFIKQNYQLYLDRGFLQVIASGPEIYPPMDFIETKRTFNDSKERVLWRTKQVIDFTFLFAYSQSQSLAEYYLIMEDDLLSAPQYITAVRDFVEARNQRRWVALEFTLFHCIGLLLRTKDLPKAIKFLLMFYQNQPVDMLLREFISLEVQEEKMNTRRNPSIFQHVGKKSTLSNKVQHIYDKTFGTVARQYAFNRNPKARVVTTMEVYNDFVPDYAYKSTPGYFWGIPKPSDTFDIVFPTPLSISRIVIFSGYKNVTHSIDTISSGYLEVSEKFEKMSPHNNSAICYGFKNVTTFQFGYVDYYVDGNDSSNSTSGTQMASVQCIRVRIGSTQKSWVVLREIQIFRIKTSTL